MKYYLVITETAFMDLDEIFDYIANDNSLDIAINVLDEIKKTINNLKDFPDIGIKPKSRVAQKKGYKLLLICNYNVYYQKTNDNKIIIHRIRSAKMSFKNQI